MVEMLQLSKLPKPAQFVFWHVLLAVVICLPFITIGYLDTVLSFFYDWMYYGNHHSVLSLSIILASVLGIFLTKKLKSNTPLISRAIAYLILSLIALIGLILPINKCEEYYVLNKESTAPECTYKSSCDAAPAEPGVKP